MKQQVKPSYVIRVKHVIAEFLQGHQQVVLTFVFLLIVTDVLFLKENSDVILFSILAAYIASILYYKLSGAFTFLLSFFVLIIMSVAFIVTGTSVSTEKSAVWLFFLIGVGVIQQLRE